MIKIGLTGGIGSGKSTVAKVFEILGIPVFYADDVAKQAYTDPIIRAEVEKVIGPHVLTPEGINKELMRKEIFGNDKNLTFINELIHPWVATQFANWRKQHLKQPYIIKEAAILIESGSYKDCDKIILVTAPIEQRISSVSRRDNISREEVERRIALQMSDAERTKYADLILKNDNHFSMLYTILQFDNMLKA
jgi:dephospho-CoA kinase